MTDKAPRAFFERARQEADRYGPDDWVFARELLQNARDAGARRVVVQTEERDGKSQLRFLDDGSGMTLAHAQRYLFSLYTSSKDGQPKQAGRFGVGFWSVLRFHPNRITIRSHTESDPGFGICLDLDQNLAYPASPLPQIGTEILLERDGTPDGQLERRTRDALKQNGRFLRTLERTTLDILVNGRAVNEPFSLPAPSVTFEGKGFRGAVGLGGAPRVELFSRGLRVRAAVALDDLLSSQQTNHTRVVFPEMPDGLAPQAILDSDNIELLLDRTEAREQKSLIRLVKKAERQLARLVERQLKLLHPEPWWQRLRRMAGVAFRKGAPVMTLFVVVVAAFMLAHRLTTRTKPEVFRNTPSVEDISGAITTDDVFAYRDLARRYHGPRVDQLGSADEERTTVALRYDPGDAMRHFAALRFVRFGADGDPVKPDPVPLPSTQPVQVRCDGDCLRIALQISAERGTLRLPLPVNHALAGPVKIDGIAQPVFETAEGLPALMLKTPTRGMLTYHSTHTGSPTAQGHPPKVRGIPEDVIRLLARARRLPPTERVALMVETIRERIRYDRSGAIAAQHLKAQSEGAGFLARTFAIGAGDCDVQNAVLAVLLQQAGLHARLSAGYVGVNGQATPLAHAWAEALFPDGQWRVADASLRTESIAADPEPATTATTTPEPVETDPVASLPRLPPAPNAPAAPSTDPRRPLAVGVALLLVAGLVWRSRPGRAPRFALDPGGNLPALIAAALAKPHLFRRFEGLFHHHLVPTLGGPDLSIEESRQLANLGRLYSASAENTFLGRKGMGSARVIDALHPVGGRVAKHLGAIDLDGWQDIESELVPHPLLSRVEDIFADHKVSVRIGIIENGRSSGVAFMEGIAKLPTPDNKHPEHETLLALDGQTSWVNTLSTLFQSAPDEAVFSLIDRIVPVLGLPKTVASAVLATSAHNAIVEAGSGSQEKAS